LDSKAPRINLGDDARSTGKADQNGTVTDEERSGKARSELSDGPRVGERGEYLPARYAREIVVETSRGPHTCKFTVEDR
jgi:hypothetical protein